MVTFWTWTIRAFRIADEIAQDIDQKNVAGIGQVEIEGFGCLS